MELKHFSLLAKSMPPAADRHHCTILVGGPGIRIFYAPARCATIQAHQRGAPGLSGLSGIIQTLNLIQKLTMEAERINAIGNQIADLAQRGAELRRYL